MGEIHHRIYFLCNGEPSKSKTLTDDYFFLEQLILKEVEPVKNGYEAKVYNPSPEVTPAILVEYFKPDDKYTYRSIECAPNDFTLCSIKAERAFLLYNEQREVLPLIKHGEILCIRNQKISSLNKIEDEIKKVFVFDSELDQAYELEK